MVEEVEEVGGRWMVDDWVRRGGKEVGRYCRGGGDALNRLGGEWEQYEESHLPPSERIGTFA